MRISDWSSDVFSSDLRQRRGAATPLAVVGTLAQLADLVLTHEENIAGHLAEAAGDEAEPVAELDEAVALVVPGHRRHREVEFLGERRFDGGGPVLRA